MLLENKGNELPAVKKTGGHYDKLAIQKIVEAIEGGMRRSEVCLVYGLSGSTISDWMREYGSASYKVHKRGHLNKAQKRSMIRAIREGRMTLQEAKLAYHMQSYKAILTLLQQEKGNSELSADMKSKAKHSPAVEEDEE